MERRAAPRRRRAALNASDEDRIDTMGTNVYSAKDNQSMHKSLNGEFILYQVLLQRILDQKLKFNSHPLTLVDYFEPDEKPDQEIMTEYDTKYDPKKAIHWYTRESCVYKILNKALRTHNIDDIIPFNQLVRDLNKQLGDEHRSFVKQQSSSTIQVYRGQLIGKDEVNRLKFSKGQLISMNSFLSTSTNRKKALEFATSRSPPNDKLTTILLEIKVDLAAKSKPYADIKHLSAFSEEEEILFMFGCVFRINEIHYDEKLKLWMAKFTVCSEEDKDMKSFKDSLDKELHEQNPLIALGTYLIQVMKFDDAQEHYEKILENDLAENELELAYCYRGLAQVNNKKGDYEAAKKNIHRVLDYLVKSKKLKEHSLIPLCYNDLASIYSNQTEYITAFEYYEKALITVNNLPSQSYSGLGDLHFKMKNYQLALEYFDKSMQYQMKVGDTLIADTYIQTGRVYAAMGRRENASKMFEKAAAYQTKLLSADHPDLGYTYGAIGLMYMDLDDESKAFEYIDKAYQIQLGTLRHNHPDFAQSYEYLGNLYMKKLDYDRALENYEKKLENQLKTLSPNHPTVIETYRVIGDVHWKKGDYAKTLVYYHKVLESELKRKQFGDPVLSKVYEDLAAIYHEKYGVYALETDLDDALKYHSKHLENELGTKLREDFSLIKAYETIAKIYSKKHLPSQSLVYYNRLLDCLLRRRSPDTDALDAVYKSVGKLFRKKSRFDQTILTYRAEKNSPNTTGQPETIENVHFEDRHLELVFIFFLKRLQKQTEKDEKKDSSKSAKTNLILANIAYEREDLKGSLTHFLGLMDSQMKKKPFDHRSLINTYQAIATIHFERKDYPQSLIFWNRFLDCQQAKKSSERREGVDQAYLHTAQLYLTTDYFGELSSLKPYNRSIPRTKKSKVTDFEFERSHLNRAITYFRDLLRRRTDMLSEDQIHIVLGNLSLEVFNYAEAMNIYRRLLDLQLKRNQPNDGSLLQTYFTLGQILRLINQSSQAQNYFQQSYDIARRIYPAGHPRIYLIEHQIRAILHPIFWVLAIKFQRVELCDI